jgi:hypothetical protein
MGRSAVRQVRALLAVPRRPLLRLRWLAALVGPALALPLAAVAAHSLATGALAACPPVGAPACGALAALAWSGAGLVGGALLTGLALGVLRARGGGAGRPAGWLAAGLAGALPLVPAALAPAAGPRLPAAGLVVGLLALLAVVAPVRLADTLLVTLSAQRRQWWQASLRAARLTRRTLGLGVYRQLCRDGFVRVRSVLYPGRTYLVPRRTSPSGARVLVEEHGCVIGGLCLRPRQPLPDPEEVVAHVLLLRGDERAYLAAANFFPYDTVLAPQATARRL